MQEKYFLLKQNIVAGARAKNLSTPARLPFRRYTDDFAQMRVG
jgi:hypothetical protein